jgi:tetratricopeptide (TPR) repeat protein
MNRPSRIILLAFAIAMVAPEALWAQRPSNNVQTRSAALYMNRARQHNDPEERRALYQQALTVLQEGTQQDPRNPRVWYMAGQALVHLGNYVGADSMFRQAEQLYPQWDSVRIERQNAWIRAQNQGVTLQQQNRLEDAAASFENAALIFDGRPEANLSLGALYHRLDRPEDAVQSYRAALAILRGPARQDLQPAQAQNWREWEEVAAFNMAQILATRGHDEEAIQAYRDFLEREPDNVTARVNLAVVLTRQGNTQEASDLYRGLLDRPGLGEADYTTIGVGLFRAQLYPEAARAFRSLGELNPYSRDAWYNLTQALYLQTAQLEEQARAGGPEQARIRGELRPLYEEMLEAAAKARQFDPLNENLLRLTAQAHRGLADQQSGAAADAGRRRAVETLEARQALPFMVEDVQMHASDGRVRFIGRLRNNKTPAGQPMRFRLSVLGENGEVVATEEVNVAAPAAEELANFEVQVSARTERLTGWKIEPVS